MDHYHKAQWSSALFFTVDHEADYTIMARCVRAKFEQNPDLMAKLKATGKREIVEHTVRDARWGDGGDGRGTNWLGLILMDVRNSAVGH